MVSFREMQWDNGQPVIDIEPLDEAYFSPILKNLSDVYNFPLPEIQEWLDGSVAHFEIQGSWAEMRTDEWFFSITFGSVSVRDEVLAHLQSLPPDSFE
jgi:hypothetical protein